MAVYQVAVAGRTIRVEVGDGSVRVDDGDEQPADLLALHGPLYALTTGDQRREVMARVDRNGVVNVFIDGLAYEAEVVDEAHARLASMAGGRSATHAHLELKAPMPGLVVRLLCRVGDGVEAGQPLAVLQAMKMENELGLPRGGTVTQVNVEPGATVEQGQVLVVLE